MRICLVGTTHPCHNPRLLREADSLAEAGHSVRVVAPSFIPELERTERRLLAGRKWRFDAVDLCPTSFKKRARFLAARGRRRMDRWLSSWMKNLRTAESGYLLARSQLEERACREDADWFIAHTQGALPVAAAAAKRWNGSLGFDCEDLLLENSTDPVEIVRRIEETYVPLCRYISVPSLCIAQRFRENHPTANLSVLYNVFPKVLAEGLLPPQQRTQSPLLRLHWMGQVIGPRRGIEEAVEAASLLRDRVELHLRGNPMNGYRSRLESRARRGGALIRFHPIVAHDALIQTMGHFDVGLALEQPGHGNYSRTVSNKIFSYLLAGLAIAATDTPGQQEIMNQVPSAGFLFQAGNPQALADGLKKWVEDPQGLRRTQQAAWDAAHGNFCWDNEKGKFFRLLLGRSE